MKDTKEIPEFVITYEGSAGKGKTKVTKSSKEKVIKSLKGLGYKNIKVRDF